MTLGARHYSNFGVSALAARQSVRVVSALVATLFAGLLSAFICFSHVRVPHQPVLVAQAPSRARAYFSFLDSRFELYFSPTTFSESFVIRSNEHLATLTSSELTDPLRSDVKAAPPENSHPIQHIASTPRSSPLPAPRSPDLGSRTAGDEGLASALADKPTILETLLAKLFGRPSPSSVRLAYAATDDGQLGDAGSGITSRYDQWTAVYDISARTVYMPDGSKLEAHSGFGPSLDDPTQVGEKDRGPTPPNVYNLELRAQPFHGVSALRLIPVDDQKTLGRTGLLAHSFMLGPDGGSNGCVSFKDYDAFLRAYMSHQIKRLVVVASLN